jgi:hypothetical protein
MCFENTSLWQNTLGKQGDHSIDRLRIAYLNMREHIEGLLEEVRKDFPNLTDHSIKHVDNLWRIASLITGDDYAINPLEGFILGGAFLIHDSVLSYKAFGGKEELRKTIEWQDYYQDIIGTQYDTEEGKQKIDFKVIRQLHAKKCGDVIFRQFEGLDGNSFYLLSDEELRIHYGQLIGEIASSHHWETEHINGLPPQVNGLSADWVIRPQKLACILRCADAAAIDSGRAPDYLFRLLRLNGVSKDHWVAQNRLGVALDVNDKSRLVFTSTHNFDDKDFAAWNVAYDAVKVVEEELNKCQNILTEEEQFQVKGVSGANSRQALAKYIKTNGWVPCDVSVHISDVAHLIMTLGGKELYGKDDIQLIVLRELIQNARDAIQARRILEHDNNIGKIIVKVFKSGEDVVLSVIDNGVGMSFDTISHSLLNFGNSFWHEDAVNMEFPGLKSAGFKSVGQYGIGFFSVFMIAKSVMIETRKYTDALKDAHLVKFPSGITLAPIFANHTSASTLYSTVVSLTLENYYKDWPIEYEAKSNKINASNFKVPFASMLGTLVAGLDVDVYYKEFDNDTLLVHHRIDAADLDKKAWLRSLSLADYQNDKTLDAYIDANYNRLNYVYDDYHRIVGLAAIGTRFMPLDDFLGGSTVGGLLSSFHSRNGEYWIGVLDRVPGGAKRSGREFRASEEELRKWAQAQLSSLGDSVLSSFLTRFRLQLALQYFKTDPKVIAVASCILDNKGSRQALMSLEALVGLMAKGKKLLFMDSDFMSKKENEGHGDSYMNPGVVATQLQPDEMLYSPLMNSGFLSYKLVDGGPIQDFGFVDCLYRVAKDMGYQLLFSYRDNFAKNNFGVQERALVMEVKKV